ncbi:hypothetical protein F5Y08DRAFT_335436 [Xylaria arbuscula]|nr:hypothetical protein F5Y08DRAFT_335436 [Xylaria arbuscula]
MSSCSGQGGLQLSSDENSREDQQPSYSLLQYLNADATITEHTSGLTKGVRNPVKKSKRHVAKAKEAIEKFDKAWGKK